MKKALLHATLAGVAFLFVPALRAINVSEPPDFPNSAAAVTPAFTYTLSTGGNVFSGQIVAFSSDTADFFAVVVPAGFRIASVQTTTNAGTFVVPTTPAGPGTYTCGINPGQIISDVNWTITFTLRAIPDYDVTTTSTAITVTNNTNNADTLSVFEQAAGNIAFSAAGRTFSLNSGANNSGGTLVSLTGITAITINGGSGGETFSVGGFSGTSFPSLTLVGGVGNDTVNFTGNITFASGNNLTVNLQSGGSPGVDTITVSNGAQLIASGNGAITMLCSKNVSLSGGAVLQTVDGNIDVEANQQTTPATGNFNGVNLDGVGTMVKTTGDGSVTVKGTGGNDSGGFQLGVNVVNGAKISGSSGVNVTGTGGACTNIVSRGVTVNGPGSAITTTGFGDVNVTGTGGANSSAFGIGVSVLNGGSISGGNGNGVFVTGTGVGAAGSGSNQGVEIGGSGSLITSSSGNVFITGTAGVGASSGLLMSNAAALTLAPTSGGLIKISSDSVSIDATSSITTTYPASYVVFTSNSPATRIDLGGAGGGGVLGLSDAILDRVSTSLLAFDSTDGDLSISQSISPANATNVLFEVDGGHMLRANASGIDLSLGTGILTLATSVACPITGAAADTGYPQLNVVGGVELNGVALDLTGTTLAGVAGNQFTIIKNSGSGTTTTGTFDGLPEGAYLVWPGDATLAAQISYVGGASGHDVVLTLVPVANALRVTSTANDSSIGSLPTVLAFAAAHSGADTITFDPTLGGQTITLTGPANGYAVTIGDSVVTIDASSLPTGLTISGAGAGGNYGLFQVNSDASLTLRGLTLANGGGSNFHFLGGAIYNQGALTLINCTLSGNSCDADGGAIYNANALTLMQCTLSGNHGFSGGAIENYFASATLIQCTLTGNTATYGGAIYLVAGTLTLTNSIVAANTASNGADMYNDGSPITLMGANLVQGLTNLDGGATTGSGTIINAAPLLVSSLGNYGGPTQTRPPLLGSPAIDHGDNTQIPNDPATGLPFTTDQRGKTRIQNNVVDIGAVETTALQVTTKQDFGNTGSLRQIVSQATDVTNTITFAPSLSGAVSTLVSGEITLSNNIAIDASALAGGFTIFGNGSSRIFTTNSPATVVLTNLLLTGGDGAGALSSGSGGAIYNNGATLTLNQCALSNNFTSGSAGVGGAIRQTTGTLTLNRCTVANNTANTASANVGGLLGGSGTLALNQCTFTGNSTGGAGGAIASAAGGGVLTVDQCTISGNQAALQGGGINSNGALTLTNSIVAGNAAPAGADIDFGGVSVTRSGRNVIGNNDTVATQFPTGAPNGNGDYAGTTASPVNPLLAPLGNYGGPTLTMALLMGTPAHNAAVNSTFTTDQRGFAITDGHPDIGAYEAGNISNFNAWIYENLPANCSTNAAVHATTYDYDGDGVTNFNEWLLLTNPGDSTSFLHITQTTRSGSNFSITFPSGLGRHYSVEGCTDLVSWTTIDGPLSGTGSSITRSYIVPVGTTPKYFLHVRGGP